jgi:hypothetical protein
MHKLLVMTVFGLGSGIDVFFDCGREEMNASGHISCSGNEEIRIRTVETWTY